MTIEVHNLAVSRGGIPIFADVSFALSQGDALLVKGPNGSGKTTLLRALSGLIAPDTGTISIEQEESVFASHLDAIKSALTVQQNLNFWSKIYGRPLDQAVLTPFDLDPLLDRYGSDLSAGQKRRLGLARVAISGAKNWLLDEPTNSLDQKITRALEALIQNHRKNGGIVVVSSHQKIDLPQAKTLDLSAFKPSVERNTDPFLEGAF
ncbi:MAG: heme ABC exporter ATP-binding protein CcmA [Pseudomonadota bacterium]